MLESLKKNRKGILMMLASALCVCLGQLFWKLSVEDGWLFLVAGFALYVAGALLMVVGYRFGKLSVLQPVLSINYGLSVVLGFFVLGEAVTLQKCIAIVVIVAGVFLVAAGDEE
jgi:undecaprenyl phosphate-alpha-L-ara4N flippase subunit ArnE